MPRQENRKANTRERPPRLARCSCGRSSDIAAYESACLTQILPTNDPQISLRTDATHRVVRPSGRSHPHPECLNNHRCTRDFACLTSRMHPHVPPAPSLLDRVREVIRVKHYSLRTEEAYVAWIRRYVRYHGKRHPSELGSAEIEAFLTALAVVDNVASATQTRRRPRSSSSTARSWASTCHGSMAWSVRACRNACPRSLRQPK